MSNREKNRLWYIQGTFKFEPVYTVRQVLEKYNQNFSTIFFCARFLEFTVLFLIDMFR